MLCALGAPAYSGERLTAIGPPQKETRVPKWNARGPRPLPWQGIAAADLSDDGRFIAVGTIAPPGDPNVFLLDDSGKLVGQYEAGRRWINEVAVGDAGSFVAALCSTPTGQAGDRPGLYTFINGKQEGLADMRGPVLFHYGDHSNHLAHALSASGGVLTLATADGIRWSQPPAAQVGWSWARDVISFAAGPNGRAVVGVARSVKEDLDKSQDLFLVERGKPQPLWGRLVNRSVDPPAKMEPGLYGPPAPAYDDLEVYAPLAVAIDADGKRVAAADYQGWVRWFRTEAADAMGNRFMPARPAITVYDEQGKEVRRFAPETFRSPFWCDLAFSSDGKKLLAWPHNWTCRALGGQTILPADDQARRLYALDVDTGGVDVIEFPDAISDLAVGAGGTCAVGCWNGRVYLLGADLKPPAALPAGVDAAAPSLLDFSRDGSKLLVATTDGIVRLLAPDGKEIWRVDLNKSATHGDKPWTAVRKGARPLAPGVWRTNGNLAHSDMGGQYLVRAPQGLLLIDPNGGVSFEQNWANIQSCGFDPMEVKYILPTHEHGDHSPAASLWRVITGAQVVALPELAYSLQHHLPFVSGYGFHPPIATDMIVNEGDTVDLAGLKVQVLRLAGHTYGSVGWAFETEGKKYAAIGDVIMPGGTLGYSGSLNFSAANVLASLHKLQALKPDYILGGHGQGKPDDFIAKGIEVGEATGWGRMQPIKPDPFYALTQKNYLVAAWREPVASAVYPDVDNDGRPDVVVLEDNGKMAVVKVYLNKNGTFAEQPSITVPLPGVRVRSPENKFRCGFANDDKIPDLFVSTESKLAILLSQGGKPDYAVTMFDTPRATHVVPADLDGDGLKELIVGHRFVGAYDVIRQTAPGKFAQPAGCPISGHFDMQLIDVNNDGKEDLVFSGGEVLLRQADGSLAKQPAVKLQTPGTWAWMSAADFNNDGAVEIAQLTNDDKDGALVRIFDNTRDAQRPFSEQPSRSFTVPNAVLLRDGATAADWNMDGIPDLIVCSRKSNGVIVLLGGAQCLSLDRTVAMALDYAPQYDTKLGVADFNGDGLPDLAGFGQTRVGVPGVYVWLQMKK